MSKEELEKNQKSPPPEPTLPETINQPEKIEPIKKEQIPDINIESEYTDHLGFDKKYWNNDEFQFHDFLKKQEKNESKLSIDAPNISKNRLHEYLNDDLINALDVSPKIPPQNINTPTSENEILLPNIENTNSSELFQFSLYNNKKNSDKETSTKSISTTPKNLIDEIIKKNTESEIEKKDKNNSNNNLINLDDNNKDDNEDDSIDETAHSSITQNIIKDNNNLINKNITPLPFLIEGSGNIKQNNENININKEDEKNTNKEDEKNNDKEDENKIDKNTENNNIINDSENKKEELKEDVKKTDLNTINESQNKSINTTNQNQQTHLNPYYQYNIRENKFDVNKKYINPVTNPHFNQKKNSGYKPKKPFEVRVGDWTCSDCGNLNFAFRSKCNRCGLLKEVSIQKRKKTEQEQFFYNPNNPENSLVNFNGVMVPLRNKNEQYYSKYFNNPGYVIILGQPQLMCKNQKNKETITQESSNTNSSNANENNNTNDNKDDEKNDNKVENANDK